jgi:hypothetical protein
VKLGLAYEVSGLLYGYQLLALRHLIAANAEVELTRRWGLVGQTRLVAHQVHDADYAHLEAIDWGGWLGTRLQLGRLRAELAYDAVSSWATPTQVSYAMQATGGWGRQAPAGTANRGNGRRQNQDYLLAADYSLVGHGPLLFFELILPWRLALTLRCSVQWRAFAVGDQLINLDTGEPTRFDARRDTHLELTTELRRALPWNLWLALQATSLDNFSSVADNDLGWDRSYNRRLVELLLRWHR